METQKSQQSYYIKFGFSHDPFGTPVAEQELKLQGDVFYSYFTSPQTGAPRQELNIKVLRSPQDAFIFGAPGSGKSTLRLTLEADCRTVLDGTMTVTYNLGEDFRGSPAPEEHARRLSRALAIDLLIQVIEQFNPSNPYPSHQQIDGLQRQIQQGGERIQRLIRRLLEHENDFNEAGKASTNLSVYWHMVGKAPVRYVTASGDLFKLLKSLLVDTQNYPNSGWDNFWDGLKVAQMWGFQRTLVLVDGVDAHDRSRQAMFDLISPLLAMLPDIQERNLFFKFFLPSELEQPIKIALERLSSSLHSQPFLSIIEWDSKTLQQILAQRFRSAGIRSTGLDALAEPGLDLDAKVIQAARRSPRRMLQIVHALFQNHIIQNPETPILRQKDWDEVRRKWQTEDI